MMQSKPVEFPKKVIELVRQKLSICTFISGEMIQAAESDPETKEAIQEYVARVTIQEFVYIHPETFEHPADWWEAFKERFFPAWALARWPVRMTVLSVWSTPLNFMPEPTKWRSFFKVDRDANFQDPMD